MKRIITTIFVLLIALQFTCGHVSGEKISKNEAPRQNEIETAMQELNATNADFWNLSNRIDSILSAPGKPKRIIPISASDPVNIK